MKGHQDLLLRELADAGEPVRRILERAGLDYCCAGDATLGHACEDAGLDLVAVESELDARDVRAREAWARAGVTELVDDVVLRLHPRSKQLLGELVAACARLSERDASLRELREAVTALASHAALQMTEEEQVLFLKARALAEARKGRGPFPSGLRTMHEHRARLREGHAALHGRLRRVRALVAKASHPAAEALRARVDEVAHALTEQMHVENNVLIPRVLELEPDGREAH